MREYSYWSSRFGPAIRFALGATALAAVRVPSFVVGPQRALWLACLAVAGVAWSGYAARAWGIRVAVDDDGATVHNLLRAQKFDWHDIDRFAVDVSRHGRARGVLKLRDGAVVPLEAVRSDILVTTPWQREAVEDLVASLNRELCRRR